MTKEHAHESSNDNGIISPIIANGSMTHMGITPNRPSYIMTKEHTHEPFNDNGVTSPTIANGSMTHMGLCTKRPCLMSLPMPSSKAITE